MVTKEKQIEDEKKKTVVTPSVSPAVVEEHVMTTAEVLNQTHGTSIEREQQLQRKQVAESLAQQEIARQTMAAESKAKEALEKKDKA